MRFALLLLVACSQPPKAVTAVPPVPTPPSFVLPSDDDLGELALMPTHDNDVGSWLPRADYPVLLEEAMRKGKPSWLAIDSAGVETTLTYGYTVDVKVGCDNGETQATRLEGEGTLKPGVLWLRPTTTAGWKPKPLAIAVVKGDKLSREYRVGTGSVQLLRKQPKSGVANVTWNGATYALSFERADMEGADNDAPMDLSEPSVGQPEPEAAWSFGKDEAALIVFRVPSYEGANLKTVLLSRTASREVASMTMYIYRCAF